MRVAGRHAINIDLRGHGGSEWPEDGRYDFNAYVEDLRAVLSQMRTRSVVVAATQIGWVAAAALAEEAATLAAGLVLVDLAEGSADVASAALGGGSHDARLLERFAIGDVRQRIAEKVARTLANPVSNESSFVTVANIDIIGRAVLP